jgi:hypothetical protein
MVNSRPNRAGFSKLMDSILDKGVAVDSNSKVCLSGINLLAAKSRIFLSSFESGREIGLVFPKNTNLSTRAWRDLADNQTCPFCGMDVKLNELLTGCPWCGWTCRKGEK